MRILVTGAAGFVGAYLMRALTRARHEVVAADAAPPRDRGSHAGDRPFIDWHPLDVVDAGAVSRVMERCRPDALAHLAAMASVPQSQAQPDMAYRVNVMGTLNLLRSARRHVPDARILVVSTAQVYGNRHREAPLREDAALEPGNAYSESKAWADYLALLYADRLGQRIITVRPHNHTGAGQSPAYAVPAFARQVAEVARGRACLPLNVGNLDSRRDISDVRDVVEAYRRLLEKGRPARAYNVASGHHVRMRDVLEQFCRFAGLEAVVRVDPDRWRPTDESPPLDTTAIRADTGWMPRIPLTQTLRAVWRAECEAAG